MVPSNQRLEAEREQQRRREREERRRLGSASAYDLAATTMPPRGATGDWHAVLSHVLRRRLGAW